MKNGDLAKELGISLQDLKKRAGILGISSGKKAPIMSESEIDLIRETIHLSLSELRIYKEGLDSDFRSPIHIQSASKKLRNPKFIAPTTSESVAVDYKDLRKELQTWVKNREKLFKQEVIDIVEKGQPEGSSVEYQARETAEDLNSMIELLDDYEKRLGHLESKQGQDFKSELEAIHQVIEDHKAQIKEQNLALEKKNDQQVNSITNALQEFETQLQQITSELHSTYQSELETLTNSLNQVQKKIDGFLKKEDETEKQYNKTLEKINLIAQESSNIQPFDFSISSADFKSELQQQGLYFDDDVYEDCWIGIQNGDPLLFIGAPGTGKSKLAKALPAIYQNDITIKHLVARDHWNSYDIIGGKWIVGKKLVPHLGHFSEAIFQCIKSNGRHWLFIDELNRCNIDKAFDGLIDTLDDGFNSSKLLPHPDLTLCAIDQEVEVRIPTTFRLICAMNYFDDHIYNSFSSALRRRFKTIYIQPPTLENEKRIIKAHVLDQDTQLNESGIQELEKDIDELLKLLNEIRVIGKKHTCKESEIGASYSIQFCKTLLRKKIDHQLSDVKKEIDKSFFKHFRPILLKTNIETLEELYNLVWVKNDYPTLSTKIGELIKEKLSDSRITSF